MERAISEMERIKRAEEISSKRKKSNMDVETGKRRNIYKGLFEILILVNIAIIFVAIQNKEYIFSSEFIEQVNSYNINIKEKIEEFVNDSDETEEEEIEESETENTSQEESGVGGAIVENEITSQELSQMEQDAENIKNNYSLILPLSGTKTSSFGTRESSNSIVTTNHTGVDIAASQGTVIVSAMSGTVTLVSSEGDYGNHLKITDGNLTTLYAHCLNIYVSEGQEIAQGQEIAEVGSTGNSTGPHLHFEIRYEDRYVDPELILEI